MAIDLSAVFRVKDAGTAQLKRIMQQVQKVATATQSVTKSNQQAAKSANTYRDANGRLRDSLGRFVSESNRASSANSRFAASMGGMQSALVGIAGAYIGAQGAAAAFNATIGAAAKYEQSEVAVNAIFNDKEASSAYLAMVDKMAIDSPLLNSGDMLSSSKGLVAMTKNVSDLGDAWSVIERLMVLDPTQGTEGAAFALKEMWQGDSLSMVERFGLNKGELNRIKKLAIPQQIAEISKLLDGMGITQSTVNAMGETTLGYWAQIQERAQKFMRTIGESGNSKLGDSLGKIVGIFDNTDMDSMAASLGDMLGGIVDKAITVGQWLWKWREPVAYIVGALTAATGAFMLIGAISLLANPIALIGAGVAALVVGFKALYDNSEPVRNVIDGLVGKAKALFEAFQNGGVSGLADRLFGSGTFESVKAKFEEIKTYITEKITELQPTFERLKTIFTQVWGVISSVFSTLWNGILKPGLENFWSALQILGDVATIVFNNVIVPALGFAAALFSTLWAVAGPILTLLGAALSVAFGVLKFVWDTILAPLVEFILGAVKNAFDGFTEAINIVGGAFDWVGGIIDTISGKISGFVESLKSVKLPDWVTNGVNSAVNFVGKVIGGKPDGSHFHGLDRVKYDGYVATLHRNEMVLPAQEADVYRKLTANGGDISNVVNPASSSSDISGAVTNDYSYERVSNSIANQTTNNTYNSTSNQTTNNGTGGSKAQNQRPVNINMGGVTVREEADIDRIADGLVRKLIEAEAAGV